MSLGKMMYDMQSLGRTFSTLKNMFGNKGKTQKTQSINTGNATEAVAELALLFETMYDLLESKGIISDAEFKQKFDELDMQDGVKDGKLNR